MPISADQERELLNKYKLTSLHPTEWPHQDDSDDEEEEEQVKPTRSGHLRQASGASRRTRISFKTSSSGRNAQADAGVQKDEPDALGMAPSVAAELRKRGLPVDEDLTLRNKFMLSSTSFNPALYLSQVHQNTPTEELKRGQENLNGSIEQKSASLKVLVESNFDRFVNAKATIDHVYTEMRYQGDEQSGAARASQIPAGASGMRPHSRQTSKNHSHFRNTSGPWGSQNKIVANTNKTALTKEAEYGVAGIKAPLQDLAIKAEEVWGPALGGREKEETLKAVESALAQHREMFTLGGTIAECIKKSDYDGVVDAYRKAKAHADRARKIAETAKEFNAELGDADVQQIIVAGRMWYGVNREVEAFKLELWKRLKTSHGKRPAAVSEESDKELHMELLATLLQLGVEENPIWVWINSYYLYLKDKLARSFERSRIEIEIQRRRLAANSKNDIAAFARHLRSVSTATGTLRLSKETTRELDNPAVLALWDRVQSCVASILSTQNGILAEIIEWYNAAQDFVENKAQKSFPTGVFASLEHLALEPEHVEGIRVAALDLTSIVRESVTSFFQDAPVEDLSDLYSPMPPTPISPDAKTPLTGTIKRAFTFDASTVPPSPKKGDSWEKYAFWPPGSNSLSGTHYLAQMLAIVGTAMGSLATLSAVKQSSETEKLKTTVTAIRERLITAVCSSWSNDSEKCDVLESWTRSPDRRDLTLMPAYFEAWEERVLTNVQKIAYVSDATTGKNGAGSVQIIVPPSQKLLNVVRATFTTTLYKSLNALVENAEQLKGNASGISQAIDPDGVSVPVKRDVDPGGHGPLGTEAVDASNRNVRMLLTLSNLNHLRSEVIPQLISLFESSFTVKLESESTKIREVLSQIDSRLFQSYVQPTIERITTVVERGITARDWEPTTPRPTDARPYVYDVLLLLVFVHADVSSTTTGTLTNQVLSYLLEQTSLVLITAFKKREHYTLPALMQATLDVEFLAQTLNNYTTDRASEVQSEIYLALDERTDNAARSKLQGELPEMRGILKKLRESTKGQFGCFRRERRSRRDGQSSGNHPIDKAR